MNQRLAIAMLDYEIKWARKAMKAKLLSDYMAGYALGKVRAYASVAKTTGATATADRFGRETAIYTAYSEWRA